MSENACFAGSFGGLNAQERKEADELLERIFELTAGYSEVAVCVALDNAVAEIAIVCEYQLTLALDDLLLELFAHRLDCERCCEQRRRRGIPYKPMEAA
jgi:hypothetical protein